MPVDSFKWVPRSIAAYYQALPIPAPESIPWTPLTKPLTACRFALVTTAGIHLRATQPPFDLERERREPTWGDPTYREIPRHTRQEDIGVAHLHINTEDLLADMNIALPLRRFEELEAAGEIGSLAPTHYSFMGYQGGTEAWERIYGPEVARRMKQEEVDAVLLTPV